MTEYNNEWGQPIGQPLSGWQKCDRPSRTSMVGQYCTLERLSPDQHAAQLFDAFAEDKGNRLWTYLPYGPFESFNTYLDWLKSECLGDDPLFYAIVDSESKTAVGVASYLRIQPAMGVIEVGHINYSPALQKTRAATEVMYLMMKRVFDELGYRRYEWKCDALNEGSRRAAERLGFKFEGIFRQAAIYKGRTRNTAWYSIIDTEWPILQSRFEHWLNSKNFDSTGTQRCRLTEINTR